MNGGIRQVQNMLIPVIVVLGGLLFSYWHTIASMISQWLNNDDFSHGILIIPISAYLVWERRNRILPENFRTDWRALSVLFLAILIYIIGELGAELFTTRVSLLLFFIGTLWLLYGLHLVKTLSFPLAFLFLMLPLPGFIYRNLTFPLQLISSKWSVSFLHFFGIMAFREGNIIDLGFTRFQVVEACNGLRFILPLFTLGVLFACWKYKPLWKRLVLIIATIPIAICANIVRIGGTGIIAKYWGEKVAEGFFHGFSGWAVFMLSFALFFGINWLLELLPSSPKSTKTSSALSEPLMPQTQKKYNVLAPLVIALVITLLTPPIVSVLGKVPPKPLKQPLSNFPLNLESRIGEIETMDPAIWERVGGQDYFLANYYKSGAEPINFYVAYYEYQRKAGDFIHSPRLCLPGAGWFIESSRTRHIKPPSPGDTTAELKINEMIIRKGENSQLIYFWYQGRDRNFTNEFAAKFWMVWDGIWRRRTDGALVRVVTALPPNQAVNNVRQILNEFAWTASRQLNSFLP